MEQSPPIKPPRGVKTVKESSGLLMSVIRTLSSSETNEQRDKEKAKLEYEYKNCDRKLDELVLNHEEDLTKVRMLFGAMSQVVSDNRVKIAKVKENLQDCKQKLDCKRDDLKKLWLEGLEHKHMVQLIEEIEKINKVPDRLAHYMSNRHFLHATQLLVEAVALGKGPLEGVQSLTELIQELDQKKEQLHLQLLLKLKEHLYVKPAQNILTLRRQESGRESFATSSSPLRRDAEMRLSARNRSRNLYGFKVDLKNGEIEESLSLANPEENSAHFVAILVKCLALLDKLPYAILQIMNDMQTSLLTIIQRTTQNVKDYAQVQSEIDSRQALTELVQILFDQFKEVAEAHTIFLQTIESVTKSVNPPIKTFKIQLYWTHVQNALESFINDYLDIQNVSTSSQSVTLSDSQDLSSFFAKRKPQTKKKSMFKFDSSSSALTLSDTLKSSKKDKILIGQSQPNNILVIFRPFMCFIEDVEQAMGQEQGHCQLHSFLTQYVSDTYLKRKSDEIIDQIESSVRTSDAWKATVLLDCTADYKPLLVSTASVERCIREWKVVLQALPLYSERIALYSCKALKEYKGTCLMAYQAIVQPTSDDGRICSATWLKDEDISRFLKNLPNWQNLKTQQEYHARADRSRRLRRDQRSEEESPEEIRMRNRQEAEILASNLGEGGVSASEIISDMSSLKELAQLQESMEWFSVRMFQYSREFRQCPGGLSPGKFEGETDAPKPISAAILQQLTSMAQEFDELANTCLLLLHLEVRVQCFHYLEGRAQTYHSKETHEPDPKVLELSRVLANVDEAMTSSLHPRKCKYIFEGLGHLIAKILISSAQYLQTIDDGGIQRMCRNIFALQQTLTNITMTRELALDHARHYFELFFNTPEEILNGIMEKGPEFSELEYMNAFQLLNRSKSGRDVGCVNVHLERLSDILGEVGMTV